MTDEFADQDFLQYVRLSSTLPETISKVVLIVVYSALGRLERKSLADRITAECVVTNLFYWNDKTVSVSFYLDPAWSILSRKFWKGYLHFIQCWINKTLVYCLIDQVLATRTLGLSALTLPFLFLFGSHCTVAIIDIRLRIVVLAARKLKEWMRHFEANWSLDSAFCTEVPVKYKIRSVMLYRMNIQQKGVLS